MNQKSDLLASRGATKYSSADGIANLTKDETTMLVYYGNDRSQQFAIATVAQNLAKDSAAS
jgi:hypothetical protein